MAVLDPDLAMVRKRPGMYVGDTGDYGKSHLLWEAVANVVDLHLSGRCGKVTLELARNDSFRVEDDGPGFDVSVDLVAAVGTLHRTPSLDGHSPHRHLTKHGLGISVISALSERFELETISESRVTRLATERGIVVEESSAPRQLTHRGTRLSWRLDRTIFDAQPIEVTGIRLRLEELAALEPGLSIWLQDHAIHGGGGVAEFLAKRSFSPVTAPFTFHAVVNGTRIDAGLLAATPRDPDATLFSYGNLERTVHEGTHVTGFWDAVRVALPALSPVQARQRLLGFISIDRELLKFDGPTKTKVGTPEMRALVREALVEPLHAYFAGPGRAAREYALAP